MNEIGELEWLVNWYDSHCNGDWEHQCGIRIDTLDNPGWTVAFDLERTEMEGVPFSRVLFNISEADAVQGRDGNIRWYVCDVIESKFVGYGGPQDLSMIISIFRKWVNGVTGVEKL